MLGVRLQKGKIRFILWPIFIIKNKYHNKIYEDENGVSSELSTSGIQIVLLWILISLDVLHGIEFSLCADSISN